MELRTILFGYSKRQFEYFVNNDEAEVVKRIFDEYISGKTLLQIATALTNEQVIYYRNRTNWSKQAVRRIIENEHYVGDKEYPAIISRAIYKKANSIRLEKGGDREKDSPEIRYLKFHTQCSQCGGRVSRKCHYSREREAWNCVNGCKTLRYLDDKALLGDVISIVNSVIEDPNLLLQSHGAEAVYTPTIKIQRDERTLNDLLKKESVTFLSAKKLLFDVLAEQFDQCRLDKSFAVTDVLLSYVSECEKIVDVDVDLFKVILDQILVDENGRVSIRFINDAIVTTNERGEEDE